MRADLVVRGRIATLAGDEGFAWVDAIAVAEGRVVAAGSAAEIAAVEGRGTRSLDVGDEHVVLPGITDAHLHLVSAALAADRLDVSAATGLDEVVRAVGAAHQGRLAQGDRDGWLTGRGWSLDALGAWPTADVLEAVAPGRPVALEAFDGHGIWGSRAALRAAEIDRETADPAGGIVLRDATGEPTGVLLEEAVPLLDRAVPVPDDAVIAAAVTTYTSRLTAAGIVACHDPGEAWAEPLRLARLLGRLGAAGDLPVRALVSIRDHELDDAIAAGLRSGCPLVEGNDDVRFGWLKLFADGTLGSRTAAMLEPYCPEPGEDRSVGGARGTLVTPPDHLTNLAVRAARAGVATQIHAIGDRAVRVAVDALAAAGPELPLHPRIEHAQAVAPADAQRAADLGVVASVQPIHLRGDAPKARVAWADRLDRAYPWRSMWERGVTLAFGSDAPIEPADPWVGLTLAVTRRWPRWTEPDPFGPTEALDLARALRAACLGPATSAREREDAGLASGARADLVVVPADVLAADGGGLADAAPVLTLVGGREVFRDPGWDREVQRGRS